MNTGEKIKQRRKELKITQSALEKLTGITVSAIQKYEYGKMKPKIEQLQKLATALKCAPIDLLDDDVSLFNKWNVELNAPVLREQIALLEQVAKNYGADTIDLLESYTSLNKTGKAKAIEYIKDLLKLYKEGD